MKSIHNSVTSAFNGFVLAYLHLANIVYMRIAWEFVAIMYQIQVTMCRCAMFLFGQNILFIFTHLLSFYAMHPYKEVSGLVK